MICLPLVVVLATSPGYLAPSDWQLQNTSKTAELRQGAPVYRVAGAQKGAPASMTLTLEPPPRDVEVTLSFYLKGAEEGQWVSIDTKAWGSDRSPAQLREMIGQGFVTTQYARMSPEWKLFQKTLVISRGAKNLTIEIKNITAQPFEVAPSDMSLGQKVMADLDGPGVMMAQITTWVKPAPGRKSGLISFPVPLPYGDQVPLAMKLRSDPPGAIKGTRFVKRKDGLNWLLEAEVEPKGTTSVTWQALVLARPITRRTADSQEKLQDWLKSSKSVQVEAPEIQAKAQELAKDDPDIETYAQRVVRFTCDNRGAGGEWNALDALTALKCAGGGSCTNRANLAAALLRARGIPTRTVAHLPTWAVGQALFTHWLVEYWNPRKGWVAMESTYAESEPPTYARVVLAISSVEDEDGSSDPLQTRWVLPGAPLWSVARIDSGLTPDPDANQQANWAIPLARTTGSAQEIARLFEQTGERAGHSLRSGRILDEKRFEEIEALARTGSPDQLRIALRR